MKRAIELARKGGGAVLPNPLVGAVIVKDGRIIGEGYHKLYGELHAERNALSSCTESPEGATIYVTLEPCSHQGKQPPCTDALIGSGIKRVVIGSVDPNPLSAGKGIEILKQHGIEVEQGLMEKECSEMNKAFFKYITTNIPFVTMKYAMTLDGKIATHTGKSKWITSDKAREYVHKMRSEHMAIMTGVGTVLTDDPMLNVRCDSGLEYNFSPIRIICDTELRTTLTAKLIESVRESRAESQGDLTEVGAYRPGLPKTIIVTSTADSERKRMLESIGVKIVNVQRSDDGTISIPDMMKELGALGISSIFLEGGGVLNWSMLKSGYVDRAACFVAPKIFGGIDAKTPVMGEGISSPDEAFALENATARRIGTDLLIEGDVKMNMED